jgi:hypothetical protein
MAIPLRTVLFVAFVAVCSAGCQGSPDHKAPTEKLVSGCGCDEMKLSDAQLHKLTEKASSGDLSAAKELWDHYVWYGDKEKAAPWEEQLFNAGDADVIGYRSSMLFSEAYHLADADPMKLALLKRSLALDGLRRKAIAGNVMHVMINGKLVDIPRTGEPDEGTANMQRILARVEVAQRQR